METPCLCPSEGHKYGGRKLTKNMSSSLLSKACSRLLRAHKVLYEYLFPYTGTVQIAKFQQISHFFNLRYSILGRPFNIMSRKS